MGKVVINILPVGQGAMNLIEGYDDSNILTDLLLIDMGNEMTGLKYSEGFDENRPVNDSIEYVRRKMGERVKSSRFERKLDLLFITHRDQDHYRFLEGLFQPYNYSVVEGNGIVTCKLIYDKHEDSYTASDSNKVKCKRTRYFPDFYTENDPYICLKYEITGEGSGTASLFYRFHEIEISGNCKTVLFNEASLDIELRNTGKCIECEDQHIISRFDNSEGIFYIEGDTPQEIPLNMLYSNAWDLFNDWMLILVDKLVYKEKQDFLDFYYEISSGIYKTYDEVIAISKEVPRDLNKPIYKCVIGGMQSKAAKKQSKAAIMMDILSQLSQKVISTCDSSKDILKFQNGTSAFRLLHYYNEIELQKAFGTRYIYSLSNATSAVGLFYENDITTGFKFLFPGDATKHTFIAMQNDINRPFELLKGSYWVAPHHGSAITLCNMVEMLKDANIRKLFISAGYCNKHGHPYNSFIDDFTAAMESCPLETAHDICINGMDSARANAAWKHKTVTTPIYTVLECKDNKKIGYVWHSFEYKSKRPDKIIHKRKEYISSTNRAYEPTALTLSSISQRKAGDPSPAPFYRR